MRIAVCLLFFFYSFQVMAQSKQFVEFIGWSDKKIELQTISNRTKQSSCTFVMSSDSIRAFVFTGQQLRLMKQFGLPRKAHERLLGGFMRDSSVYMFTEQAERGVMHCTAFNVVTEQKKETFIRLDLARGRMVTFISAGSHFIYVTANYRTKELSFFNFTNEQPGNGLRYQFSDAFWRELLSGFGGRGNIQLDVLDQEGDPDLEVLARSNKLYITNDTLLLVMNNHIDSTYITCIDLKQFKAESWLVEHTPGRQAGKGGAYSDNSFLFRNKLYYARATNDSLLVQVADPYTGEIHKTFFTERRDDITYKNTPFREERTVDEKRKDPRDVNKTSSFLRRMVDGNAVIMARPFGNDQIEVMVGSYEKTTTASSVGGYPGFNNMPYGGYGYSPMMMRSPYYNNSYNPGRYIRSTWTNSTNFKMLLNSANFEHVEGEPGSSVNERIDRYTSKMKIDPESESLFVTYGQHYYAYYDKGGYKLVVLKF